MPILYGDPLAGKFDATADRKAGLFRVDAIHQDIPFGKTTSAAVRDEVRELARWLELDVNCLHKRQPARNLRGVRPPGASMCPAAGP